MLVWLIPVRLIRIPVPSAADSRRSEVSLDAYILKVAIPLIFLIICTLSSPHLLTNSLQRSISLSLAISRFYCFFKKATC